MTALQTAGPQPPQPPQLPPPPSGAPADIAPAPPPAAPGPTALQGPSFLIGVPRTAQELSALRARRSELSDQLVSATSRRNQLAQRLRTADGANRVGLEQRLQFLDRRILQLENDIAVTGQQLTAAPANLLASGSLSLPRGGRFDTDFAARGAMAVGSLFTILVLAPMAFAAARLMWRRANHPRPAHDPETVQRLARLETAVDTIAIEVERVAEGQRFLTRLFADASGGAAIPPAPPITEAIPAVVPDERRYRG